MESSKNLRALDELGTIEYLLIQAEVALHSELVSQEEFADIIHELTERAKNLKTLFV